MTNDFRTFIFLNFIFGFNLLCLSSIQLLLDNTDTEIDYVLLFQELTFFLTLYLCIAIIIGLLCHSIRWIVPANKLTYGLIIYSWLQGSFFTWSYGEVDGRIFDFSEVFVPQISWDAPGFFIAAFELLVFEGVLLYVFRKLPKQTKLLNLPLGLTGISLCFVLFAGLQKNESGLSTLEFVRDEIESQKNSEISAIHSFSRTKNVILVVLDSVQSDFFHPATDEPNLREKFRGFTFYRNAISHSRKTMTSLPTVLTSKQWNGMRPSSWAARSVSADSIISELDKQGYLASVVSTYPSVEGCVARKKPYDCYSIANYIDGVGGNRESNLQSVRHFINMGMFKMVPHVVKPWVFNGQTGLLNMPTTETIDNPIHPKLDMDLRMLRILSERSVVNTDEPVLKLFHFFGSHRPFNADENCQFNNQPSEYKEQLKTGQEVRRRAAIETTTCVLKEVGRFFDKLKEIGVFDDAVVLLLSDHGNTVHVDLTTTELENDGISYSGDAKQLEVDEKLISSHGKGIPIFLVKDHTNTGIEVSDRPVALCDVPNTVSDLLDLPKRFECKSIYDVKEDEERIRIHQVKDGRNKQYNQYKVIGHSWFKESWRYDMIAK